MKKLFFVIVFGGILTVSCTKKPDHSMQDSNQMLPEPEATTASSTKSDSTKSSKTTMPASVTKLDSAKVKK